MRNGKSRTDPWYVKSAAVTRPSTKAWSNHSSVRAPSLPAGMYLCVAADLQVFACRRKIEHRRGAVAGNRREEARGGVAVRAGQAHVVRFDRPGLVRFAPAHRSIDGLRRERLAKHPRQLELSILRSDLQLAARLRHLQLAAQSGGARRTQHRRDAQVIEVSLHRILRRALGSVALESEGDVAERTRRVQRPQPRRRVALRQIREQRPQGIQHDAIGLAARLGMPIGRALPLAFYAGSEPRGGRPRHVQIRHDDMPLVLQPLRAHPERQARIAEHLGMRSAHRGARIGFVRMLLRLDDVLLFAAAVGVQRLRNRQRGRPHWRHGDQLRQIDVCGQLDQLRALQRAPHLHRAMTGLRRRPCIGQHIGPTRQIEIAAVDTESRHQRGGVMQRPFDGRAESQLATECARQ